MAWCQGLLKDLESLGQLTQNRTLKSVFFGGGTPSLMSASTVAAILNKLSHYWCIPDDLEVTLEANPNSVEVEKLRDFKAAGVNRISIGIQSLNNKDLKFLGRKHDRGEALSALKAAHDIFDRFSFDLIYARPEQTMASWKAELEEALSLAKGHISLYQLTIEPGTAFYTAYNRGDWTLPDQKLAADLYDLTTEMLGQHNLHRYEISNYAQPGHECQHNLIYWRSQDYGGIGPGAHGRLTLNGQRFATSQHKAPETWLDQVQTQGHGTKEKTLLTDDECLEEFLMMGLRTCEGIPYSRLEVFSGYPRIEPALKQLINDRFLEVNHGFLKATEQGFLCLNSLLLQIL